MKRTYMAIEKNPEYAGAAKKRLQQQKKIPQSEAVEGICLRSPTEAVPSRRFKRGHRGRRPRTSTTTDAVFAAWPRSDAPRHTGRSCARAVIAASLAEPGRSLASSSVCSAAGGTGVR
jgi:hypothetical protein